MQNPIASRIAVVERHLRAALGAVAAELRDYPTPIAGCDAQYTGLLADKARLGAALAALEAAPFIATPRTLAPEDGVESR